MDKTYKIIMPEIKVITPKLELLDNVTNYSSNKYTINNYKDTDTLHIHHNITSKDNTNVNDANYLKSKSKSNLILKRSKPFRKYTNTLEKCMNLKIKK